MSFEHPRPTFRRGNSHEASMLFEACTPEIEVYRLKQVVLLAAQGSGQLRDRAQVRRTGALDCGHGLTAEPGFLGKRGLMQPRLDSPISHALAYALRRGLAVALGLGMGAGDRGVTSHGMPPRILPGQELAASRP